MSSNVRLAIGGKFYIESGSPIDPNGQAEFAPALNVDVTLDFEA
jgi:hypothetical protein